MNHKPLHILIVDDEEPVRTITKKYLSSRNDILVIGECENIIDAKAFIRNNQIDLVLLDIKLGNETGFDLLSEFPDFAFKVIFITAYDQYTLKALKIGALDYLLKPIGEDDFHFAIDKVKRQMVIKEQYDVSIEYFKGIHNRITLNTREGLHILFLDDIMYCEADAGYTTFYLNDGSKPMVSKPLKDYEALLPSIKFMRVHQTFIVNIDFVILFKKENNSLILRNKLSGLMKEIPVSTRKKEEILKLLTEIR
jgi:two-component system, LytTR family, response regulator